MSNKTFSDPIKHGFDKPSRSKCVSSLSMPSMMDTSLALYFSAVATHLSISTAAHVLGVNASTVSRKIDELEQMVGVRLFDRGSRGLRLTEAGETYIRHVRQALQALEEGKQSLDRFSTQVRGSLRVQCPPSLGQRFVGRILAQFSAQHPQLKVSLQMESQLQPLSDAAFDIAISIGLPPEERAVVSKIGTLTIGYVATSAFLASHGTPNTAAALAQLPIAAVPYESKVNEFVQLKSASGESLNFIPAFITNDYEVVMHTAMQGTHIGRMVHWYCATELASGALRMVMPELNQSQIIYLVVPTRKGNPLKIQLFVDCLKQTLVPQLLAIEQSSPHEDIHKPRQ